MKIEDVIAMLKKGGLLSAAECDAQLSAFQRSGSSNDDTSAFVWSLVDQRLLTGFQAQGILAGIPGPYALGPYRVSARISVGNLGDLFHAEHAEFHQPVSLKVFPPSLNQNTELMLRLGREARVSAEVSHPNVVRTLQVGKVGTVPFIAMEPLDGETLGQRLARVGRLGIEEACDIIRQAALGLDYLHHEGVIHRDIRPNNLWVGSNGVVKIMEFGAAIDALSYLDSLGDDENEGALTISDNQESIIGHYDYMSAEQAANPHDADVSSDLYSLGCTFYHCLTGQVPFPDKNPVRQMLRHSNETPKPLTTFIPDVGNAVVGIVDQLLAKSKQDRFRAASVLAETLALIVPPTEAPPVDAINSDFLNWLQSDRRDELQDVGYEPEAEAFMEWLTHTRFDEMDAARAGRS